MKVNEKLLDEKLAALEKARTWSPRVVSKLESLIRAEDDFALFRVNPIALASEKNIAETESIDLFLHATKLGLFEMNWNLLCPFCSDIVTSFASLKTVHSHFFCTMCREGTDATLDDFIQVSFTVSPQIRTIAAHDPESLSVQDYYLKYRFSREGRIPGGPRFIEAIPRMLKHMSYFAPGEKKNIRIELERGQIMGHDLLNNAGFMYDVSETRAKGIQAVSVRFSETKAEPDQGSALSGTTDFEIENTAAKKASLLLLAFPPGHVNSPLEFEPYLSGKKLLSTQSFRDLFRTEVIEGEEGIGVRDLTFLFTDLKGSTELYDRIGDLKAFALVRQHFDTLGKVVSGNRGAIVKTIGDAVMATFLSPEDAIKAATGMIDEIQEFNDGPDGKRIILKIGVHKGASIAVTLNERLDYFGQSVNIAARVQGLADAEEIYVTEDVYGFPGVRELLSSYHITPKKARLKGVQDEMQVYRIEHR
ncbi:MAG: adenylate/guanylate cyclase domain-containing protein [Deltaproteobacteria bacterium]|nr:adenylate/guanylate cyclase domain-containing protein [Deltaproteobacteria bacterium]